MILSKLRLYSIWKILQKLVSSLSLVDSWVECVVNCFISKTFSVAIHSHNIRPRVK